MMVAPTIVGKLQKNMHEKILVSRLFIKRMPVLVQRAIPALLTQ